MQPQRHQSAARRKAVLGSLLFLAIAPGVVAGLLPWWLTGWDCAEGLPLPVSAAGVLLVALGVVVLLHAFARFVVEGVGTPAAVATTRRLVVGGPYRYVRNPMYLAVAATIVGQAMILGRPVLLLYAAAFGVAVGSFVHSHEEPTLARQFGAEYEAYRRAVPAWLPRRQPWAPNDAPLQRRQHLADGSRRTGRRLSRGLSLRPGGAEGGNERVSALGRRPERARARPHRRRPPVKGAAVTRPASPRAGLLRFVQCDSELRAHPR